MPEQFTDAPQKSSRASNIYQFNSHIQLCGEIWVAPVGAVLLPFNIPSWLSMALHFPNASRNYDATRHCVRFWGHDSTTEVSFYLEEDALFKISPYSDRDEASMLHVFDVNLARIQEAASIAYGRSPQRQSYHRLSASDLSQPVHRGGKHGKR
jgi:hypothetical protein